MAIVKINAISVPEDQAEELERRFRMRAGVVEESPGFLGFQLLRPVKGEDRYFVVTQWEDEESYAGWRDGSGRAAHKGEHGPAVMASAELLEFEVLLDVKPGGENAPRLNPL
jgi:heme-degrading monooxygenase HmoA